jgi:hypothetical protein
MIGYIEFKKEIEDAIMQKYSVDNNIYRNDLYFFNPYTNEALALLSGIEYSISDKNFLCAAILTRSLLDCTMSLIYVMSVPPSDYEAFIEEFIAKGELTKLVKDNKKRIRITGKDLTSSFSRCTQIDFSNTYKQLSKMVHPTIHHLHASTHSTPNEDSDFYVGITPGKFTVYPQHLYDELEEIVRLCMSTILSAWKFRTKKEE